MADLWKVLVPILMADLLNPILFAYLVYAAGSERPVLNSCAAIAGHTVAYLFGGILFAIGLEEALRWLLANPKPIDFHIELVVGILLLWAAIRSRGGFEQKETPSGTRLNPLDAYMAGVFISFASMPFGLPYFAAINQILKADSTSAIAFFVLIAYNFIYALPFLIVPLLVVILGDRSRTLLDRVNQRLQRGAAVLMPLVLGAVALALIADAINFYVTGDPLFRVERLG